ncbi:hypothetical protein HYH03_002746 [Edaphochlamys debaryana]|uniref:Centrosomal protein POC5 n=1 Tax=Edaphochlamys debaryana TaxID=47281 RepID=A0A836C3U0_9CHLO|nr:hypothetical protein HYH03_002746 [Edaphochlamys debaryana]|eukprot:KAG2499165.1 hypothetical protein HYH03_002746 [Edaphochlamys debaryana]
MMQAQPLHPLLASPATRTSASAYLTTAPPAAQPSDPGLPQMQQTQPAMSVSVMPSASGGGSSIDIVVPAQQPATSAYPQQDGSPTAGLTMSSLGGAAPTSVNITALPPGITAAPPQPAAVEITISQQQEERPDPMALASHLEGLTVAQMLDLDIDALATKIDHHHCKTKKAVLEHFMETKARLMQSQNDSVEEEKRKWGARLAAKEEEIKILLAEMEALRAKAAGLWETINRACALYAQAKERRRATMAVQQLFYAWREQALLQARRRRRAEKADRFYVEVHLKRNVFRAWFREAMREHRVTLNNRYIQEVENAKRMIHEHYQGQIGELERLLADSRLQLEREAEARARLEDNMKRAFMRGVCALNIEAMNVMKRGAPPGGANPFPISLPPVQGGEQQGPGSGPGGLGHGGPQPYQGMGGPQGQGMPSGLGPQGLSEAVNLDLRGSITLSPSRTHGGGGGASSGAGLPSAAGPSGAGTASFSFGPGVAFNMAPSQPGPAPSTPGMGMGPAAPPPGQAPGPSQATSITGAVRMGSGGLPGSLGGYGASSGGGGGSNRPSASGVGGHPSGAMGAGGNPLVVKATGLPPHGAIPPAAPDASPALRETAQSYYSSQRPSVMVTRGPGMGAGGGSVGGGVGAEAPRPRAGMPLPTVRLN